MDAPKHNPRLTRRSFLEAIAAATTLFPGTAKNAIAEVPKMAPEESTFIGNVLRNEPYSEEMRRKLVLELLSRVKAAHEFNEDQKKELGLENAWDLPNPMLGVTTKGVRRANTGPGGVEEVVASTFFLHFVRPSSVRPLYVRVFLVEPKRGPLTLEIEASPTQTSNGGMYWFQVDWKDGVGIGNTTNLYRRTRPNAGFAQVFPPRELGFDAERMLDGMLDIILKDS